MAWTRKEWGIIRELAWSDFKLKYNRSVLGFLWSFIKPLLMLLTLYIVFHVLFKWNIPHYELFLLLGIILWNFFSEATSNGMNSIISKQSLIKKIFFRRRILVLSSCLTDTFSLVLNLLVFLIFMLIFKMSFSEYNLIFLLYLAELFILTLGISYGLSALYVKYRDMKHIWDVLLQIGFWITPIVYTVNTFPQKYVNLIMLNPLARIINDSRDAFLFHYIPSLKHIILTIALCLVIYFIGFWIFKKISPYFAEKV
jgi:lipopolysaccharide transport system permease protein